MTLFGFGVPAWQDALALTWAATLVEVSVVAGLAWCIAAVMKTPAARHRVWCAAMATAVLFAVSTYLAIPRGGAARPAWTSARAPEASGVGRTIAYLWIGGASIGIVAVASSWLSLRRFSRASRADLPDAWRDAFAYVSGRFGLSAEVRASPAVAGAATYGWLRPTIVVAPDASSRWSPAQFRSVLAHEFEHIRRRDYAWGLFHSLWACLYFFHPAAAWLCAAARREREFCCDDRAAGFAGDPALYVRTLAELEAGRRPAPLSLPIAGSLLARSARLLGAPVPRRGVARLYLVGSLAALLCGGACLAWARTEAARGNTDKSCEPAARIFTCACS